MQLVKTNTSACSRNRYDHILSGGASLKDIWGNPFCVYVLYLTAKARKTYQTEGSVQLTSLTNHFKSADFDIEIIICFFTKRAILM
jgi:hypothetical protein